LDAIRAINFSTGRSIVKPALISLPNIFYTQESSDFRLNGGW
jgi:hypothetical protein